MNWMTALLILIVSSQASAALLKRIDFNFNNEVQTAEYAWDQKSYSYLATKKHVITTKLAKVIFAQENPVEQPVTIKTESQDVVGKNKFGADLLTIVQRSSKIYLRMDIFIKDLIEDVPIYFKDKIQYELTIVEGSWSTFAQEQLTEFKLTGPSLALWNRVAFNYLSQLTKKSLRKQWAAPGVTVNIANLRVTPVTDLHLVAENGEVRFKPYQQQISGTVSLVK